MRMIVGGLNNKQKAYISAALLCVLALVCVLVTASFRKEAPKAASGTDYIYGIFGNESREETDSGMNILLLGRDFDSNRTDAVVCVSVNFTEGSIKALQIPRDSYVKDGDFTGRLTNLLPRYKTEAEAQGSEDPLAEGIARLMKKLEGDLGLPLHRYVFLESKVVATVTDAIGGVTVQIPADIDYTDAARAMDLHLKKGKQSLDGETAAMFVRYRQGYPQADMGRLDAQKLYVAAVIDKLKSFSAVAGAVNMAEELAKCVKTDMSAEEIARVVACVVGADAENITMFSAPGNGVNVSGASYYGIYNEKLKTVLSGFYCHTGEVKTVGFSEEAGGYLDTEGEKLSNILEYGLSIPVYLN